MFQTGQTREESGMTPSVSLEGSSVERPGTLWAGPAGENEGTSGAQSLEPQKKTNPTGWGGDRDGAHT